MDELSKGARSSGTGDWNCETLTEESFLRCRSTILIYIMGLYCQINEKKKRKKPYPRIVAAVVSLRAFRLLWLSSYRSVSSTISSEIISWNGIVGPEKKSR